MDLEEPHICYISRHKKTQPIVSTEFLNQGYKDSNLEMTESESVMYGFESVDFMGFPAWRERKLTYGLTYRILVALLYYFLPL